MSSRSRSSPRAHQHRRRAAFLALDRHGHLVEGTVGKTKPLIESAPISENSDASSAPCCCVARDQRVRSGADAWPLATAVLGRREDRANPAHPPVASADAHVDSVLLRAWPAAVPSSAIERVPLQVRLPHGVLTCARVPLSVRRTRQSFVPALETCGRGCGRGCAPSAGDEWHAALRRIVAATLMSQFVVVSGLSRTVGGSGHATHAPDEPPLSHRSIFPRRVGDAGHSRAAGAAIDALDGFPHRLREAVAGLSDANWIRRTGPRAGRCDRSSITSPTAT